VCILEGSGKPKTIVVQTERPLGGLKVSVAARKEVVAALKSLVPNYSPAIMKYYCAITRQSMETSCVSLSVGHRGETGGNGRLGEGTCRQHQEGVCSYASYPSLWIYTLHVPTTI
jgi:hypothetical protein